MEIFKNWFPKLSSIKKITDKEEIICWEIYDEVDNLIGYGFVKDVPEGLENIPGMEEMDRYRIYGAIDPKNYRITQIDITLHPEMNKEPWSEDLINEEFEKRFIGLSCEEINLSPDGKIDAITEATLSSTWLIDGIRSKVEEIIKKTKSKS